MPVFTKKSFQILHETNLKGFDEVKKIVKEELILKLEAEQKEHITELEEKMQKKYKNNKS